MLNEIHKKHFHWCHENTRMAIIATDPQDLLNTATQEEECRDRELEWKRGNGHFLQICSVLRKAKRIN